MCALYFGYFLVTFLGNCLSHLRHRACHSSPFLSPLLLLLVIPVIAVDRYVMGYIRDLEGVLDPAQRALGQGQGQGQGQGHNGLGEALGYTVENERCVVADEILVWSVSGMC